jgi:AcrR family transcriptional regulator
MITSLNEQRNLQVASQDLRVRRTHKLLREALLTLTQEKGFEAVSVQDITDRAMVNRATFYRHYQDKNDLALANIKELLDTLRISNTQQDCPVMQPDFDKHDRLVKFFEHVDQHAVFYRAILSKDAGPFLTAQLRAYIEEIVRERSKNLELKMASTKLPPDLFINYLANTGVGMLLWWLEQDQAYSAVQMANWFAELTNHSLQP